MSLTITDLFRKNSKLKGYKPRIGISIDGIGEHFSAYREFASDTTLFKGITKGQPNVRQSCDRLGGLAKVSGINLSVLNLELWSDIFNTYANVENEDVEAFLYFDVANVARQSLLFDSSLNQYLRMAYDVKLKPIFPICIEMWVMFTDADIGNYVILFASDDQTTWSGIWFAKTGSDLIEIVYGDNTGVNYRNRTSNATTIVANRWYCIHALFKGTGADFHTDAKIYINGIEESGYSNYGSTNAAVAYGISKPTTICKRQTFYSNVYISQFGFWDAELTAADFLKLYGDGTPKNLTLAASYDSDNSGDLQVYWKFQNMIKQIGDDTYIPEETGGQSLVLINNPLWSWNIPCCLDTDRLQFFKGKVSDFPTIDYEKVGFRADSLNPFKDKTIGTLLTDSDAADTNQGLPEESKGKIKPIIYGDHTFLQADDAKSNDTTNIENNMVPCVYLGIDSNDKHRWLVASHQVDELLIAAHQKQIWGWDDRIGRFVHLVGTVTIEQNDSNGCIISHVISPQFIDYWYSSGIVTVSNDGGGNTTNFQNPSRAGDKLFDNASTGSINNGSNNTSWIQIKVPFPDYDNDIGTVAGAEIVVYLNINYEGSGAGDADFNINVGVATPPTGELAMDSHPEENGVYPEERQESDEFATATQTVNIRLSKLSNVGTDRCHCDLYEVYKKVLYNPGRLLPLLFAGKGREYDNWINDREAGVDRDPNGNLYTETHADHDREDFLIENATGVIESLQVDELGMANTDLNENSLNISSNDLSTSKLSFSITEQIKNPERLFDEILKTVKSVMFNDNNNQSKMKTFVSGDPYSASGDSVPNNEDIFEFDPQTTFRIETGINDKLDFEDIVPTTLVATLDAGEYTGAELATEIQTKMLNVTGDVITCTYNATTGEFIIANGDGNYKLEWLTGANASTSVGRFIGYDISADDTGADSYISNYPLWADSYVEHPIVKRPLPKIGKTKDDIKTTIVVNYFLNPNGEYNKSITDTDVSFHAETLEGIFNHPYTRDQVTAEIYLYFLSKNSDHTGRLSKKYLTEKFYSWLNAMIFEPWDFVNVREPVISGILGSANAKTQKWLITEVEPGFSNIRVGITAIEV